VATLGAVAGSVGFFAMPRVVLMVPERVTAGTTGAAFSLALIVTVRLSRDGLEPSTLSVTMVALSTSIVSTVSKSFLRFFGDLSISASSASWLLVLSLNPRPPPMLRLLQGRR